MILRTRGLKFKVGRSNFPLHVSKRHLVDRASGSTLLILYILHKVKLFNAFETA